eukprot:GILI01020352.1.p1 GENE.GILI01020352.1~~GILI01020352.1.p1  ORF type:complete len:286 (+),score=2.64 GILI01020352.1:75-932(+)
MSLSSHQHTPSLAVPTATPDVRVDLFSTDPYLGSDEHDHHTPTSPPRPYLTYFLCLTIIVVFVAMVIKGGVLPAEQNPMIGPSPSTFILFGAKDYKLIVDHGETWRLFTAMFLHGGIIHLALNVLSLIQVGRIVETFWGWHHLLVIYVLSGIFGNVFSVLLDPASVSLGASGAVLGLVASLVSLVVLHWKQLQRPRVALCSVCTTLIVNLLLGLVPYVDNYAHAGGMMVGLFSGYAIAPRKGKESIRRITFRVISALLVVSFFTVCLPLLYCKCIHAPGQLHSVV